jgi:hypothetical protein
VNRLTRRGNAAPASTEGLLGMAVVVVDGVDTVLVHRSVLNRVAEIAFRLGCHDATPLVRRPTLLSGPQVPRLRRDLDQVTAFADATLRTGWQLWELAAAPADEPVAVMDTPYGRVWVDPAYGFKLHGTDGGPRRATAVRQLPGTARRVALSRLIAPLRGVATRAQVLEIHDYDA